MLADAMLTDTRSRHAVVVVPHTSEAPPFLTRVVPVSDPVLTSGSFDLIVKVTPIRCAMPLFWGIESLWERNGR